MRPRAMRRAADLLPVLEGASVWLRMVGRMPGPLAVLEGTGV